MILKHLVFPFVISSGLLVTLQSCSTAGVLNVTSVTYQSVNTKKPQQTQDIAIPPDAKILATYAINKSGQIGVMIKNMTNEILTVDQEKSFFINTTGESEAYFDPNVYSTTQTDYSMSSTGTSVNLGVIASTFDIGGPLGSIMGGSSVSNTSTSGISIANTITVTGQRQVNIGPRGNVALSKTFTITGIGGEFVSQNDKSNSLTYQESPLRFSICISYSIDGGKSFQKLVTDFYVSASMCAPVEQKGKVNDALRKIISEKSDLLAQPWYLICFNNNIGMVTGDNFWVEQSFTEYKTYDNIVKGVIYDYQ